MTNYSYSKVKLDSFLLENTHDTLKLDRPLRIGIF